MPTPSFNSSLYDVATECALLRQKGKCKVPYGAPQCKGCQYNVAEYVDADPRQVQLFMIQANTRAHSMRQSNWLWIIALLVIAGFVGMIWGLGAYNKYKRDKRFEETTGWKKVGSSYVRVDAASNENTSPQLGLTSFGINVVGYEDHYIKETLKLVKHYLDSAVDVNYDHRVNCQDAAVLFYSIFPDRDRVIILTNVNPAARMNHAFNGVLMNGNWVAIEPDSRYHKGKKSYTMRDVWGNQYNYKLNKDETLYYRAWAYDIAWAKGLW